jgi:hypothetical protein
VKARNTMRNQRREAGIALLIAIFVLLLISVVGIALIVSSGTESALAGNYRSATGVYYASLAGLEEARGRLLAKNPNSLSTVANFLPPPGTPWSIGYVRYILNPGPADPANTLTVWPDTEYNNELGPATNVKTTQSVWNVAPLNALPVPGPVYKWVRINAVSEQSLNLPLAPLFSPPPYDSTTPVFYDATKPAGAQLNISNPGTGVQVLEVTALAVLPNGTQNPSQKLVQYLIAPVPLNLSFQSALTLAGNNVVFNTTTADDFWVKGNDQYGAGSCNPGTVPPSVVTAVGYTNAADGPSIVNAIPSGPPPAGNPDRRSQYTNYSAPTPDVYQVTPPPNLTSVAGLNNLVQTITQLADVPPITPTGQLTDGNNFMPAAMSATNPMTIVVNGDLVINGWHHDGYGLLLVTGELTYDPDAFWHGIILVIGKGWFHAYQGSSTGGHIEGALFIAQTVDRTNGSPLAILGPSQFDFTSSSLSHSGNNYAGIYYSNCWIQAAMPSAGYQVLSFHEIASQ